MGGSFTKKEESVELEWEVTENRNNLCKVVYFAIARGTITEAGREPEGYTNRREYKIRVGVPANVKQEIAVRLIDRAVRAHYKSRRHEGLCGKVLPFTEEQIDADVKDSAKIEQQRLQAGHEPRPEDEDYEPEVEEM